MCDVHAFISRDGGEEKVMENVDRIESEKDRIVISNIFGEQKKLAASFKYYDNRLGKIVFERT
jgi:predicted RNA-binding protein